MEGEMDANDEDYDDDDDDEYCSEYVESIRSKTGLEIGCRIRWPEMMTLELSTCLSEDALAPMFHGTQWAGTRVWRAAIVMIQYLEKQQAENNALIKLNAQTKIIELGCGLGVPGMILHGKYGCHTILTDKEDLVPQLQNNLVKNFPNKDPKIEARALDWSASGVSELLSDHDHDNNKPFDLVLNCDCIYEPLYGDSWKHLLLCQQEFLRQNPQTIVLTSCERRRADGIDDYLAAAAKSETPEITRVEKVCLEFQHPPEIEIYRFYGREM